MHDKLQPIGLVPNSEILDGCEPLEQLPPDRLSDLSAQVEIFKAREGTTFVELGSRNPHTGVSLKGNVCLEARNGPIRYLGQGNPAARNLLCRLRPTRYRVLTASQVQFSRIGEPVLERELDQGSDSYVVQGFVDSGVAIARKLEDQLFLALFDNLQNNRTVILIPPKVARGICWRIAADGGDTSLINQDLDQYP